MFYNSFVRSHLLCGILTWGSTHNTVLHPLQVLQNKIVGIISNVETNERITNNSLYKQLKILKIKDMYELEISKFMHQHQHNKLPNLCSFYFAPTASIHNYNTRSTSHNNLYLSSISSNAAKNAIRCNGVPIWNSLSPEWKNFPFLQIQAIYERSLNFEVLELKQIGLIYFIPGHRFGLFKFFSFDYHTHSTKHCITCAVGLLLLLLLSLLLFIIIVSKLRFSLPFVLFFFFVLLFHFNLRESDKCG